MTNKALIRSALACKCPSCGKGNLYPSRFSITVKERCASCGLLFAGHLAADGPAVFLIFILGFTVVPIALFVELTFTPPFWVHILLWPPVTTGLFLAMLRPVKAYVLGLQFTHRPKEIS